MLLLVGLRLFIRVLADLVFILLSFELNENFLWEDSNQQFVSRWASDYKQFES